MLISPRFPRSLLGMASLSHLVNNSFQVPVDGGVCCQADQELWLHYLFNPFFPSLYELGGNGGMHYYSNMKKFKIGTLQ